MTNMQHHSRLHAIFVSTWQSEGGGIHWATQTIFIYHAIVEKMYVKHCSPVLKVFNFRYLNLKFMKVQSPKHNNTEKADD